jgi:hypothetical protein
MLLARRFNGSTERVAVLREVTEPERPERFLSGLPFPVRAPHDRRMTSAAKIRANRRNALRSTGPRSLAGKAVAARNARRHGLTLPVLDEPALSREVVALARRIEISEMRRAADAAGHALACRIAEAMIDLKRVRLAKLPLTAALHADPCDRDTLVELSRLDRYERYALGRRKRAIRAFAATVFPVIAAAVIAEARAKRLARRQRRRNANDFKQGRGPFDKTNPTENRQ